MEQGYLCFVLHAHLPYVRHPEHEEFLEESWLFEAITETYIPLLHVFESMVDEGVDFRITLSITPPLAEMLADELLNDRCLKRLNRLVELADKEVVRTQSEEFHQTARMYQEKLTRVLHLYRDKYNCNILPAFVKLQDEDKLEIITCAATHAFLPLMDTSEAVHAQISVAVANYRKHFGRDPKGFWLPECAYSPGIDEVLKEHGIEYFFLDAHGILFGSPRPKYGVFAPVRCPGGVPAFARDMDSAKQVWSAEEGYPGNGDYREFYRDLGYDGHYDYIRPYLHPDGVRRNIGIKYHRITGRVGLGEKQPYDPAIARERAAEHADDFVSNRQRQARKLHKLLGQKPVIVSPYDAELFGHWWFEGPDFLDCAIRNIACNQDELRLITPSEYLRENGPIQTLTPSVSSWGDKGYSEVWLNGTNDWIYRHLHKCEQRMIELTRKHPQADALTTRALNQAARELLLLQSSDWAFIMTTRTVSEYAEKRTRDHVARFNELYEQIKKNQIDKDRLAQLEWADNIFAEIDYHAYS